MRTTTTTAEDSRERGESLREARKRAGLTRAQLAGLVGCSLASLGNIEQGAVPRRSRVFDAAQAAVAERLNDDDPASPPGRVENSAGQGPTDET